MLRQIKQVTFSSSETSCPSYYSDFGTFFIFLGHSFSFASVSNSRRSKVRFEAQQQPGFCGEQSAVRKLEHGTLASSPNLPSLPLSLWVSSIAGKIRPFSSFVDAQVGFLSWEQCNISTYSELGCVEESISGGHHQQQQQQQQWMYSDQKGSGREGQGMINTTSLGVNGSIDQNWGDSGMVMAPDNNSHSQHTDTSTDVDTDDKPHVLHWFSFSLVSFPFPLPSTCSLVFSPLCASNVPSFPFLFPW